MTPFEECVLVWAQQRPNRLGKAVEIVEVIGLGSDWQGSTEGGFYSTFGVEIKYRMAGDDAVLWEDVDGEDMASLWNHVVNAWKPAEPRV